MALLSPLGAGMAASSTLGGGPGVATLENTLRVPCSQTVSVIRVGGPGVLVKSQWSESSVRTGFLTAV